MESEGQVLTLNWEMLLAMFPQAAKMLHVPFYRTKITSWMASQEEIYRFIILEADRVDTSWPQLCTDQVCRSCPMCRSLSRVLCYSGLCVLINYVAITFETTYVSITFQCTRYMQLTCFDHRFCLRICFDCCSFSELRCIGG